MSGSLQANPEKVLDREVQGRRYHRYPVRTHTLTQQDTPEAVLDRYVRPHLQPADAVMISERVIAIMQGRAWRIKDIQPSRLARFLVRFVTKSPYGIGLGSPWTMELALREAGAPRMLFAAAIAALTRPFGIRGAFYRVVGRNINAIDGPCHNTLPPYNEYAKLGPSDPQGVAKRLAVHLGTPVAIVDANDLGVNVLGMSDPRMFGMPAEPFIREVMGDNPLGQCDERTPICIVRAVDD